MDIVITLRSIFVFLITLASPLFSETESALAQEMLSCLQCLKANGPSARILSWACQSNRLLPGETAASLKWPHLSLVYYSENERGKSWKFYIKCKIVQTKKKKKKRNKSFLSLNQLPISHYLFLLASHKQANPKFPCFIVFFLAFSQGIKAHRHFGLMGPQPYNF